MQEVCATVSPTEHIHINCQVSLTATYSTLLGSLLNQGCPKSFVTFLPQMSSLEKGESRFQAYFESYLSLALFLSINEDKQAVMWHSGTLRNPTDLHDSV
jgi:hypothetical protein